MKPIVIEKIHTIKTYPLKIPKKNPKTLSTDPMPVYKKFNDLPNDCKQ